MEKRTELKDVLAHWNTRKFDFDAKLVEREETGCCVYGSPTGENDTPCTK